MKNKLLYSVMFCSALVFIITTIKLYSIERERDQGKETYESIVSEVKRQTSNLSTEKSSVSEEVNQTTSESQPKSLINFDDLKRMNKETVAWITMDGTNIDYPVAQGVDNEYYLKHTFDLKENSCGSIFVDEKCETPFHQFLTILYGHHMRNGTMFSDLTKYKDASFARMHRTISIETEQGGISYTIFAVTVIKGKDINLYEELSSDEQKESFIEGIKSDRLFDLNQQFTKEEECIALVTCDYSKKDGRMIVYAKKEVE